MAQGKKTFKLTRLGITLSTLGVFLGVSVAGFLATGFIDTPVNESSQEIAVESGRIGTEGSITPDHLDSNPDTSIPENTLSETPDVEEVSEYVVPTMPKSTVTSEIISVTILPTPGAKQEIVNDSSRVVATPKPTQSNGPKPTTTPKPTASTKPIPSEQPTLKYCPDNRSENPELYDSCRKGFIAPTFEFAGYHSCKRLTDSTFEITGLVRMVGGNYSEFVWNQATHKGMALASHTLDDSYPSYPIRWFVMATFISMNPSYHGIISYERGDGITWIEENEISPSCLRK
jgi:hypothetical protein